MYKSWSSSYSYSSNNDNEKRTYAVKYIDNVKELQSAVSSEKNKKTNIVKEKFYKSKIDEKEKKQIFGKSTNKKNWKIKEINNNEINEMKEKYNTYSKELNILNKNKIQEKSNKIKHTKISKNQILPIYM
jgi:hypothetical protein